MLLCFRSNLGPAFNLCKRLQDQPKLYEKTQDHRINKIHFKAAAFQLSNISQIAQLDVAVKINIQYTCNTGALFSPKENFGRILTKKINLMGQLVLDQWANMSRSVSV